jgi:hypothetical protein
MACSVGHGAALLGGIDAGDDDEAVDVGGATLLGV